MKKYLVRFTTKDGDYDKAWCNANNEDEAAEIIQDEYRNIQRIDMVTEI